MTDGSSGSPNVVLEVPACWAIEHVDKNPIQHLQVPKQVLAVETESDGTGWVSSADARWKVLPPGVPYRGWDLSLRTNQSLSKPADTLTVSWLGGRTQPSRSEVLNSFDGAFSYIEEDLLKGREGLRTPQIGALHAVLGYWTTRSTQPVTVVMPTGTGKTETMLALLVAARLDCLLVLVPSDALRKQIAGKFESLGVLQRFGVVAPTAFRPVVGQVHHGFSTASAAKQFTEACNVIVATPAALHASAPDVRASLLSGCSICSLTRLIMLEQQHGKNFAINSAESQSSSSPPRPTGRIADLLAAD